MLDSKLLSDGVDFVISTYSLAVEKFNIFSNQEIGLSSPQTNRFLVCDGKNYLLQGISNF